MICKVCGESWDLDSVHDSIDDQFPDHRKLLTRKGPVPDDIRWQICLRKDGTWFDQPTYEREYFNPMIARFRQQGCIALDPEARYCIPDDSPEHQTTAAFLSALEDVMGDDVDGVEAMIQDYNL